MEKEEERSSCYSLYYSDGDLRPWQPVVCYIGDDSRGEDENDMEEQLPPISCSERDPNESESPVFTALSKSRSAADVQPKSWAGCDRPLGVDEGIGSELTSNVSGYATSSPPDLTPQISVETQRGANRTGKDETGPRADNVNGSRQQSSDEEAAQQGTARRGELEDNSSTSPENTSPVMSSYDWPMTSTEKLLTKYSYKNELGQFTRRMENIFPLFVSGQRETILQGLRAMLQIVHEAWKCPKNSVEIVNGICAYFQKSSQLDFIINMFISGQYDLRLEAGQVLEVYLSEETSTYLLQNGSLKIVTKTIIQQCDAKDADNIRLSLSLLEALFRSGPETCKMMVECGGLDFLLDVCKNHLEVDTRLHAAVALANLSIFGGFEIRQIMVRKQVPAWLFLLLINDDARVKYYACLCLCMMASNKEFERDVQNSGTLSLVPSFLKSYRPEQVARTDTKYRYGRSSQWLQAFSPLLYSTVPEVLALASFQFAMEASLRRGSSRIDVLLQVFEDLRLIPRIQEIASIPGYDLASKFAARILNMIGEHVPYKLSQAAPLWTVKDVQYWVKKIGFLEFAEAFGKHRVDGDLLLQTTDEHLRSEIGIESAYERMRFMRELSSLKRSSDYCAVDRTRLDAWLMRLDPEFSTYTYQMLLNGVDRSTLIHLDDTMLKEVCGIDNSVHRLKLMYAIKEVKHIEELDLALLRKQVDIFICYRRATGSQLASLLKVHLQLRGFKVFIDVDRLYAGQFDKSLLMNIRAAKHFILVLTPRALDPCIGDDECKDWVHLEIQTALNANANIVPVQEKSFEWPPTHQLPADIQRITGYNSIQWVHEYQEACVDKLHKFLRGQGTAEANPVTTPTGTNIIT